MRAKASIRLSLLVFIYLFTSESHLFGQVTAGSVPPGTSIVYSIVDLSVGLYEEDTTAYLDIDGDGTQDVRILLQKGFIPADGFNLVAFYTLEDKFAFCIDTGQTNEASLFEFEDTLCTNGHQWGMESFYIVGCYGGWNCTWDTASVNDKFVAYRKNVTGETGWIKISMSLYSGVEPQTITFTISEMLVLYLGSGVDGFEDHVSFHLFPNPTLDGKFVIQSSEVLSSIELYNAQGQLLKSHLLNGSELTLPESKGLYIIRVRDGKGRYASQRIFRL